MTDSDNRSELLANLQEHAKKVDDDKRYCTDEAKTRNYLVEPMLDVLGYNCRNPRDVVFEFAADVAGRKGEKVDYALMREDEPVVLVEAKTLGNKLRGNEREQLQRYFPFTPARLAVLTDGVRWRWYKGMSEPGRSHEMESSPFLTYNAQEPNESAAEWLIHLTKDGFDPVELQRVARRIDLTTKVREWIDKTLVAPNLDDARRFNATAGLGASDDEVPLLLESMQSAWGQFIGGTIGDPGPVAHVADNTDADDPAEHPSAPIESVQTGEQPSSRSQVTLEFESHEGDQLDLGGGETLNRRKQRRAWKIDGEEWRVEKTGTQLVTAVLGLLLGCDARRDDTDALVNQFGRQLRVFEEPPTHWRWEPVPEFVNLYFDKNMTHGHKRSFLARVAKNLQFDPPGDGPLSEARKIEWWMPDLNP